MGEVEIVTAERVSYPTGNTNQGRYADIVSNAIVQFGANYRILGKPSNMVHQISEKTGKCLSQIQAPISRWAKVFPFE